MDADLDQMTREELMTEVKSCGKASVGIATAAAMNSVGTILYCGVFSQKGQIRCLWCLNGQSSYEAA